VTRLSGLPGPLGQPETRWQGSATRLGVLGPLTVRPSDGGDGRIPGGMAATLLEWLVVHRTTGVTVGATVTALWPSLSPTEGRSVLRSCVSRLRRLLPADGIVGRPATDRLGLDRAAIEVDVDGFLLDLDRGTARLGDDQPEGALDRLDRALALWRGDALPSLQDTSIGIAESTHLAALRTDAEVARCAAWIATGRPGRAVSALAEVVHRDPTREAAWRLLMLGSAAAGNRSEASRTFQRCRRALTTMNQRPDPNTVALDQHVLEGAHLDVGRLVQREYAGLRRSRPPVLASESREFGGPRVIVAIVDDPAPSVAEPLAAMIGNDPVVIELAGGPQPERGSLEPLAMAIEAAELDGAEDTARRLRSWPADDARDPRSSALRASGLSALIDMLEATARRRPVAIVVAEPVTTPALVSVLRHLTDSSSAPVVVAFASGAEGAKRLITPTDEVLDLR
jgi:DNA-binding SARP family transcriptional activator